MSADSQSQPPPPPPSSQQPSLSQLWQSFAATGLGVAAVGNPTNSAFGFSNSSTGFGLQSSQQSNNNNYVNFNQFIMQHNFLGGGSGNGSGMIGSGAGSAHGLATNGVSPSVSHSHHTSTFDGLGDGFFGFSPVPTNNTSSSSTDAIAIKTSSGLDNYQHTNFFNPNSNLFQYNNGSSGNNALNNALNNTNTLDNSSSSSYNAGLGFSESYSSNPQTSQDFYENLYTPFGNSGTTYYANPFATGFDFNASSLQVTAPEFVPRFNQLTLNTTETPKPQQQQQQPQDTNTKTNGDATYTNTFDEISAQQAEEPQKLNHVVSKPSAAFEVTPPSLRGETANKFQKYDYKRLDFDEEYVRDRGIESEGGANGDHDPKFYTKSVSLRQQQHTAAATETASSSSSSPSAASFSGGGSGNGATGNTSKSSLRAGNGDGSGGISHNGASNDTRSTSTNGFQSYNNNGGNGGGGGNNAPNRKLLVRRAERERERDGRRYQNGRRSQRGGSWRGGPSDYKENNKYPMDNIGDGGGSGGKESPHPSPEKKSSPKKYYPENEKLSQREKLMRDIETRRLECLVCVEPIKAHHSVWSCNNCYHILHLQCIIKWASSSRSDDGWRCPACQNVVKEVPRDYYCFCGKVRNPTYTRQDIAHSCGEVCGRVEGCSHACTLLCHPGPCPPCQAQVRRDCGCGKTTKIMQCCLKDPIACDASCGKLLNCELHTCAAQCHEGRCPPCEAKVQQHCHCSKQERQVACTRDSHDKTAYSCGKACGRNLACGNHKCKDSCHAGECRPCKMAPDAVTSCPCGKMPLVPGQRQSCLDPVPTCEGICGRTLRCGKAAHPHHCTSRCHTGNCPPCNKQTAVKCRCGHMDQLIKCRQLSTRADDARCKKRCVKKRSCGKHKCNQECCIDIDHICPLPCNYTLSCGRHKCDQPCHRGNCPPCYRSSFDELFCECGAEVIYPPVPCGTKRPICKRPCSRTHPCAHPPQHNCHSAATCPPCMIFTTQSCFGQHEQRKTIPCSQESFSCGLPCQKPLPCGRHKCIKVCHEGACQVAGEQCRQSCTKLRAACDHKCMAPCHDGECPSDTPCKKMVEVQCECGNRKQQRSCHDLAREYSRIATAQLASSMAEMQRGNYMELSEILAPVKANKTNKTLDCNDECRLLERNRRLAIGLQIRNPDVPQKLMTKYSDFIRNFAKRDPVLVKSIHDALTTLVKLAKESKQKSRSHSFPTMNREKRQLVHEMCEMFGVDSVAYDAEPNRNVVATAHKERSWLPAASIMDVMQRESGQRRVPVPSNNAWGAKR